MSDLEQELKVLIVDALNLEDISPDDIKSEEPLFGDGLGLDSIDALQMTVAIEQKYGVPIKDPAVARQVFKAARYLELPKKVTSPSPAAAMAAAPEMSF